MSLNTAMTSETSNTACTFKNINTPDQKFKIVLSDMKQFLR